MRTTSLKRLVVIGAVLSYAIASISFAEALQPPSSSATLQDPTPKPAAPGVSYKPPSWVKPPTADDLVAAYPDKAFGKGLSGDATVHCIVTNTGAITDCKVVQEHPAGYGFGLATAQVIGKCRLHPAEKNGKTVAGEVTIPLSWYAR